MSFVKEKLSTELARNTACMNMFLITPNPNPKNPTNCARHKTYNLIMSARKVLMAREH
jgi:hypothetical protein